MTAEDAEAIALVAWWRLHRPADADALLHCKNEGGFGAWSNGRLSGAYIASLRKRAAMGTRKGTADYFLALPSCGAAGLWLELKAPGGTVKDEQIEFLRDMAGRGYGAAVAWGADCASWAITAYCASGGGHAWPRAWVTGWADVELEDITKDGKVRARAPLRAANREEEHG